MTYFSKGLLSAMTAAVCFVAVPATAVTYNPLTVEGVTYTFTNPSAGNYTVNITGINAAADTKKGRYGFDAIAFGDPTGFVSATGPAGWQYLDGGLSNSGGTGGCSGTGNFFCFSDLTPPVAPALPANSSLSFSFSVNASGLSTWDPDFKINWLGTANNYDLVSLKFGITTSSSSSSSSGGNNLPEPGTMALLGLGLLGLGFMRRAKHAD